MKTSISQRIPTQSLDASGKFVIAINKVSSIFLNLFQSFFTSVSVYGLQAATADWSGVFTLSDVYALSFGLEIRNIIK